MAYLPFELNMHVPSLTLQLCEYFDVHYFAADHSFFKKHADSTPQTGVKVTALLILSDLSSGKLKLYPNGGNQVREVGLKNNTLVLLKSRNVEWEIEGVTKKHFVISSKISGPYDGRA